MERANRELKEDFLAWLGGQVLPERPTLGWYDAAARRWALEVVAEHRHRTTERIVREAWAEERPLLLPVSSRVLARHDGLDTLVALPVRAETAAHPVPVAGTVETRPLDVYAELAR